MRRNCEILENFPEIDVVFGKTSQHVGDANFATKDITSCEHGRTAVNSRNYDAISCVSCIRYVDVDVDAWL